MIKRSVTQTKTWTYGASTNVEQDIIKDGIITHIDFSVQLTPSATLAAANQPDGPFRVIDNFSIRGGSQTYFSLPAEQGGRLWHYVARQLMKHLGHGSGAIVAPNLTYIPIMFRFHPGSHPMNPDGSMNFFDLSAFIPAIEESSLRGVWQCPVNTILDDTVTLTSAVMKATIYMVQGTPDEIMQEMMAQGVPINPLTGRPALMTPSPTSEVFPTSAVKLDYSEERDIPTGCFLRGIGILAQDATATRPLRAADEVTAIALKMPSIGSRLVEVDFETLWLGQGYGTFLTADDVVSPGAVHVANGVGYLPLKDRGNSAMSREYGMNLMNARTGDWKLGLTVATYAAGDDILLWYDRLIPYSGQFLR
jgi:hypothetical protein